MTAAAAAAWVQFADASTAALHRPEGGGGGLLEALASDLVAAVDAVATHGLAPLLSEQLLTLAAAALQSRLGHLRAALDALLASVGGSELPAADLEEEEEEEEEEEGEAFTADMEASLAEALRDICGAVESCGELLRQLCDRVLRLQPAALGPADRTALLAVGQRFRREAAAAIVAPFGPGSWAVLLYRYYWHKLQQLSRLTQQHEEGEEGEEGEEREHEAMDGEFGGGGSLSLDPGWAGQLQSIAAYLRLLDLEAVSEEAYAATVCRHLRLHLLRRTRHSFDQRMLGPALRYSATTPLQFLELVLTPGAAGECALAAWRSRLCYYVYEGVGCARIGDMFDIVVDYPDSLPAIDDLRDCLQHTNLHRRFITVFRGALMARLLHPGAATADIIQQYVSAIKALAHVDPGGAILGAVGGPIAAYLRGRRDTIRCIVTMLTADEEEAAAHNLLAEGAAVEDYSSDFESGEADAAALRAADTWEPDPVDADPERGSGAGGGDGGAGGGGGGGGGDVISKLVGIYGSKELFIAEYRCMLSDRLLSKGGEYDTDRELRTLELLKVRFGEGSLHNAEVMVKDLGDSKRINANVKSVPNTATPLRRRRHLVNIDALSATILSHLFWPPLPQEDFTLPPEVQAMLSTYAAKYRSLKAPRKLQWRPNLGTVQLELVIGEQTLEFNVSPFHASVLMHFHSRPEWPAADLADKMGVAPDVLRRKMMYWINQGVLSESRAGAQQAVYRRNEQLQTGPAVGGDQEGMEVEEGARDEMQEMAAYEPFIMGMLTNFDALPLDRVHNMLKMFVSDPPYDKSLEQLGAYMGRLVGEEKLSLDGGTYRKRA
ncbi:hypothetical protein D9Q98_003109 [Chlorella vulgaris]|uniref:Anaphase-promoting complex subunit 2 n=1 Tax=Chlorella vulgaris TaxID=3077 RepID=A0A9D4TSE0_CHLVU|nr:hypothetical protein D9Q98_003109 [Chlorella vulgaris]